MVVGWYRPRLLQSPSLVVIGHSVGYGTWPSVSWHHPFVIGWSRCSSGLPPVEMHCGLTVIFTVLKSHWQPPLHSFAQQMPAVGAVQGDLKASSAGHLSLHHNDVIMNVMASQITSLTIVYSTVYSDAIQRKHQSSASLAFVRGIPRTKGTVTRKMFPYDDVIMILWVYFISTIGNHSIYPVPVN